MTKNRPSLALGILGGGQLARMLALKAHELGIRPLVLSEREDDPAAQATRWWTQGSLSNASDLESFLKKCDVATFESEFLDAPLLRRAQKKTGTAIFPRVAHMAAIQDRLSQKRLLEKHKIPTAPFFAVSSFKQAREAWEAFGPIDGMALKKRRFGYDGNGTFMVRSREELESLRLEIETNTHGFIAEQLVRFKREVALMVVRGRSGPAVTMPWVESKQESARCLWVKGPVRVANGTALASRLARFIERVGYVGAIGVELFETSSGLVVNELAPRVHNSGHYSLNALAEDQFSAHIKAVTGRTISKPRALADGFAMLNLLGDQTAEARNWTLLPDVSLHWYGKSESRPGRKMGHVNALAKTPNAALKRLLVAKGRGQRGSK